MAYNYSSRNRELIQEALTRAHPDTYLEIVQRAGENKKLTASQALCFILAPQARNTLGTLPKTNTLDPQWTRDQCLEAWIDACVKAGGALEEPLLPLHDNSSQLGKAAQQMMKIKAFAALDKLRELGLEHYLRLPGEPAPATLLELALYNGLMVPAQQLDRGQTLTHGQVLWRQIWKQPCTKHIEQIVEILESKQIAPPKDLLDGLPRADINLATIQRTLDTADYLLARGLQAPRPSDKSRTPLGQALENLTSPAGVDLVNWLIARGHDPVEPTRIRAIRDTLTPLEACLELWHRNSLRDQRRAQLKVVAETLCGLMDPQALSRIFNNASIKTYEVALLKKLNSGYQTSEECDLAQAEIAWVRRLGLRYMTQVANVDVRTRRRMAM